MGSFYQVQLREEINIGWTSETIERGDLGSKGLAFGMAREILFDMTSRTYF
jgi:hypothetical protein